MHGWWGTEYGPCVSSRESDSKTYFLSATTTDPPPQLCSAQRFPSLPSSCHVSALLGALVGGCGTLNDPWVFQTQVEAGAPVGGLEAALQPGSLILKYTEMPSRAGLKSV